MKREKGDTVLNEEIKYFNESLDEWLKQFPGKIAPDISVPALTLGILNADSTYTV